MTDAYLLVRVPEQLVALLRTEIHANVKSGADIVFYKDGSQAQFYGSDITAHSEERVYLELDVLMRSHIASVKAERDKRLAAKNE